MTQRISEHLFSQCSETVTALFGLHFPRKRWRDLERGILCAARELGFADTAACMRWLVTTQPAKEELDILAVCLTIGETYFFREQKSFAALENQILPALLGARRGAEKRLRIWCAGCATGEEPYSVAILLHRIIADLPEWNVSILATDVNPAFLRKGEGGEYGEWSFRGTPRWLKERYFTANREGRFVITDTIRRMVTFAPLNLAEDTYPSLTTGTNAMDVIFCRNVLMYFAPEQAKMVSARFHRCLVAGGWLLVSPSETSATLFAGFESVHFDQAVFYRKDGNEVAAPPRPDPFRAASTFSLPQTPTIRTVEKPAVPAPVKPPPPPAAAEVKRNHAKQKGSPYEEALLLYRQGDYSGAAAKLADYLRTAAAASSSTYEEAALLLTRSLANEGNFTAALDWCEKAIAADRLNPHPYYLQAVIFQERGDDEAAIVTLKRVLYLDHDFVLAHFALANLTRRRGKSAEAIRHLDNAANLLRARGDDEILAGAEGMSSRRLAEIIATTRESIEKAGTGD